MVQRVRDILAAAGLDEPGARITPVTGGISSATYAVELSTGHVIVKQALAELNVAQQWRADPTRVVAEAQGLEWFNALTPQHVPQPIAVSEDLHGLILPMAPQPSPDMRTLVLETPQDIDPLWGETLAGILTLWHEASPDAARGTRLDDTERLTDLRIKPFYEDMAQRWPQFGEGIRSLASELTSHPTAVVHGDFTPKNFLCLPGGGLWIIDTEVCHIGNPVIDTASLLTHLIAKSVHYRSTPAVFADLARVREGFLKGLPPQSRPESLPGHIGVFLAVRVAGRAPVPYLEGDARGIVEKIAHALLGGATLDEVEAQWLT